MIGTAVTDDAVPVPFDKIGELLVRSQATPFKLSLPVLEELPGPDGIVVIPELGEGFFEDVGLVESFIRFKEQLQ